MVKVFCQDVSHQKSPSTYLTTIALKSHSSFFIYLPLAMDLHHLFWLNHSYSIMTYCNFNICLTVIFLLLTCVTFTDLVVLTPLLHLVCRLMKPYFCSCCLAILNFILVTYF